jgi:hypothetical protein
MIRSLPRTEACYLLCLCWDLNQTIAARGCNQSHGSKRRPWFESNLARHPRGIPHMMANLMGKYNLLLIFDGTGGIITPGSNKFH